MGKHFSSEGDLLSKEERRIKEAIERDTQDWLAEVAARATDAGDTAYVSLPEVAARATDAEKLSL